MKFVERLESVRNDLGWSWRAWEREADLKERHLSVILTRARGREDFRPDWSTLDALARAAKVSTEWLAEGRGEKARAATSADGASAVRVERDPAPIIDTADLATPLERAVGQAFDPTRHQITDATEVLRIMREVDRHDRPDADLVAAARTWLDATRSLRRDGRAVTAAALLERITVGKLRPREPSDSASEAMQREMIEHAAGEGVAFGEGVEAVAAYRAKFTKRPPE